MWDPLTLYTSKPVEVIREAPRPLEQRPRVTTTVRLNSPERTWKRYGRRWNLKVLGFASYEAYIASPLWRSIRKPIVERANGRCEACKQAQLVVVHHLDYMLETLRGERPLSLIGVCDPCHVAFHKRKQRHQRTFSKKSLQKAKARMLRRLNWTPEDDLSLEEWFATRTD